MTQRRADVVLADRGFFPSREQARAAILAGEVRADGEVVVKAGQPIAEDAQILVAERERYVSRGGRKLEGALESFGIDVRGVRALDVGASTGGFTDCLLKRGAAEVVAVDVGYGQLAWSLRNDPRVRVFERTNIRDADGAMLGAPFGVIVIDVSFIGLDKVLPVVFGMLADDGAVLALVKPQFEAGKGRVGKKGVVRDPAIHLEVLRRVGATVEDAGLSVCGLTWSPITGPAGNIEFWVWASRTATSGASDPADVVREAHDALGER